MAMKVTSNKAKSSTKSVKTDKYISGSDTATKPRYQVEEISNGFILEKSWCDEKGKYHCVKKYHETNPLEEETEEKEK